jgi:hypothetical protein
VTPSELSAIRENVSFDAVSIHDVIPLLAEVERLTAERDHNQVQAHFAGVRADNAERREKARIKERDEAKADVERLTAEAEMLRGVGCMEDGDGPCGVCRKCAYQRTAEAFQRGVETFRRHMYAFALGATSYSRPSNESQLILDELLRMQVDDPEPK